MKYKQPSFSWHPDGVRERPGLVLLLVGIVCFVAGAMMGNPDTPRETVSGATATTAIVDSAATDNTGPRETVAPPATVHSTGAQHPPLVKPAPERVAVPPPTIMITPVPAPTVRRAKIVETRAASSIDTPHSVPPEPAARRIERKAQSSNTDYQSLRRSILR
jgi:hypothetical protein